MCSVLQCRLDVHGSLFGMERTVIEFCRFVFSGPGVSTHRDGCVVRLVIRAQIFVLVSFSIEGRVRSVWIGMSFWDMSQDEFVPFRRPHSLSSSCQML